MNADAEYKYLAELRFLGDSVDYYAKAIREQANRWLAAEQTEHDALHGSFDRKRRAGVLDQMNAAPVEKQAAAAEFFGLVEAFLGVWSRMSLLLFPQDEQNSAARAARAGHLRYVLQVPVGHLLSDRDLRNRWQHFDEVLDSLADTFQRSQVFVRSDRYDAVARAETIRVFVVDKLRVEYQGIGNFDLEPRFAAGVEIGKRAHAAITTWTNRHPLPGLQR